MTPQPSARAAGEFLVAARDRNFKPSGVEISEECAQLASANTGLEIFPGTLEQFTASRPENPPLFDVVTMWDVVEHLTDPAATLKLANSILKTNGLFCLSTVNLNNYRYAIYKNKWRGFAEGQEHTFFFSPRTLDLLLCKCGFKPVKIVTRSIPPILLKWLNIFKLGHELEAYAVKTNDA